MTFPPFPCRPPENSSFTPPFPGPNSVQSSQGPDRGLTAPHPGEAPAPQQVAQVQGRVSRDGSVDCEPAGNERARRYEADLKTSRVGPRGRFESTGMAGVTTTDRTAGAKGGQSQGQERRCWPGSVCTDLGPSALWLTSALTEKVANRNKSVLYSGGVSVFPSLSLTAGL